MSRRGRAAFCALALLAAVQAAQGLTLEEALQAYAAGYRGGATPELEALALRHLHDPLVGAKLVSMSRGLRSPALFEALIGEMRSEKLDCQSLAEVVATAQVPGAEARLASLVARTHPQAGVHFARRLAEREYLAAEPALLEVLAQTRLDGTNTLASFAAQVARLGTDRSLNAVARKLAEVAPVPDEPRRYGRIASAELSQLPADSRLCGRLSMFAILPLGDSPGRATQELAHSLQYAPADAVLDRGLFPEDLLAALPAERGKTIRGMLEARALAEARARNVNAENFVHWIHQANLRQARRFVAARIDVNAPDPQGLRPLYAAFLNVEIVELLLGAGARAALANANDERSTPLHRATGHDGVVAPVVEAGVAVTRLLLARGADARARDARGATPLHRAAALRPELVPMLLAAGADVKTADKDGTTALHMAVRGKKLETAKLLLERGADVNAEEYGGVTPLLIARDEKAAELEALLESRGGRVNQGYVVKRALIRFLYGGAATITGGH